MQNRTVYLKCERNAEVTKQDVYLSDVATVKCSDSALCARLKAVKVHHFGKNDVRRCVICTLKLIDLMEKECGDISVQVALFSPDLPDDVFLSYLCQCKRHHVFTFFEICISCN